MERSLSWLLLKSTYAFFLPAISWYEEDIGVGGDKDFLSDDEIRQIVRPVEVLYQ